MRVAVGFAVVPSILPILILIYEVLTGFDQIMLVVSFFLAFFGYIFAIFIGIPIYRIFLSNSRGESFLYFFKVALFGSFAVYVTIVIGFIDRSDPMSSLGSLMLYIYPLPYVGYALINALMFWTFSLSRIPLLSRCDSDECA